MTLPDFLIIGAQKSGTTSLHDKLAKHSEASSLGWLEKFINNIISI
mgnify:CR=1 FL=1